MDGVNQTNRYHLRTHHPHTAEEAGGVASDAVAGAMCAGGGRSADTGPEQEHLVRQALLVTERLLLPLALTPIELDRLAATLTLAEEAEDLGAQLDVRLLLTRVRPHTRSATALRARLADLDLPVLAAEVRLLERHAQAHGQPVPTDLGDYQQVLRELHDLDRAGDR